MVEFFNLGLFDNESTVHHSHPIRQIRDHTQVRYSDDVTIGTCWDADRLDLLRCQIEPDPARFATEAARDPQLLVQLLNRYLERMSKVIVSYGGTIDEFIGDAILAIFGVPEEHEDDPARAVACGIAMQNALMGLNAEFLTEGYPPLEMGIGINTGQVVVGNIGWQDWSEFGKSDAEITGFMVDRYGDFVLYRPPVQGNTLALWVMPIAVLLIGAIGVFIVVRRRNRLLAEQQKEGSN